MSKVTSLFSTPIYHGSLSEKGHIDVSELKKSCRSIADEDLAGHDWCLKNGFTGYTSYASLYDLGWRFPIFKELQKIIDHHVSEFTLELDWDLGNKKIILDYFWINILPEGGAHSGHIHPQSVISGTTYIEVPNCSSAIRFEDPRLSQMMAAPPPQKKARDARKQFFYVMPKVGDVLLWESWLRHEVPTNMSKKERISISFNYCWG